MMRSQAGLILEKLLSGLKNRWLLCWDGEGGRSYDCACCLTWPDEPMARWCGCICHVRIESMANSRDMRLFLLASIAMKEFPFIPGSYDEMMAHARKTKAEHDGWVVSSKHPGCGPCEDCATVKRQEDKFTEHNKHYLEYINAEVVAGAIPDMCTCPGCEEVRRVKRGGLKASEKFAKKVKRKKK